MVPTNITYTENDDVVMSDFDIDSHPEPDRDQHNGKRNPCSHFKIAIDFGTTCSIVAVLPLPSADDQPRIGPDKISLIHEYHSAPTSGWDIRYDVPSESWYPDTKRLTRRRKSPTQGLHAKSVQANRLAPVVEAMDEDARMAQEDMDEALAAEESPQYFWGYGVPSMINGCNIPGNLGNKMARFKLLLDSRQQTSRVREQLTPLIDRLIELQRIKDDIDVIADYLTELFRHVYHQISTYHSFSQTCTIEYILCVPAIWTPKACRVMQTAMQRAIKKSEFSVLKRGSIDSLFIVSEPEAAALYVLPDSRDILPHDTFIIIDAGGGTVDAICYTVSNRTPLRLEKQVATGGALCGSSFLNEGFEALIRDRLANVDLSGCPDTFEEIIEQAMSEFENKMKRTIDVFDRENCRKSINIRGLRMDRAARTSNGKLHFSAKEMEKIFAPCLDGVQEIMYEQLNFALSNKLNITNVILTGGFAASISLQKKIRIGLNNFNNQHRLNPKVGLLQPDIPGAAVARGAILRALHKEEGPRRVMQSSFGFLRRELFNPHNEAHMAQIDKIVVDPNDKQSYLLDTITWLVNKGTEVQALQTFSIPTSHTFSLNRGIFACEEILYLIDEVGQSSYSLDHKINEGVEEVGRIGVDMTFLKTEGHIHPIGPYPGTGSKRQFYDVEFDLVMRIDDRNLHFEARWPRRKHEGDPLGEVKESGQISIAAAFLPGTK